MSKTVTMTALRRFPRADDNGENLRRVNKGETFEATDKEATVLEASGKAKRGTPTASKKGE